MLFLACHKPQTASPARAPSLIFDRKTAISLGIFAEFLLIAIMGDDLRQVLIILHEAGAEGVPSHEIGWEANMMPAINVAINMGYMRYRERAGERYFYLTPVGYQKIGIKPFSVWSYLTSLLRQVVRPGRR
ncbi:MULTISPECIES: hypothetical protein [Rhizobium]|uniref:hypothetical protein n=1 Tax=Rhizobium TaxID=379 RepID=UPI0028ABD9AD